MRISLETTTIQGIPTLTLSPAGAEDWPLVFFIPGYGSTKEAGLSLGYRLARRGHVFVSFDPWLHGERYDRRLDHASEPRLGGVYPPASGLDTFLTMLRVIHRCLEDAQTLLAHLWDDPRVDVTRCGVTGPSMGGYASFLVFAKVEQMAAAVPMIGIPTFTQRWVDVVDESRYSNPEWASVLAEQEERICEDTAFVERIDPYETLKEAAPRALLMMNCDFDSDQPKLYSIYAYRELRAYYAECPDKLRLRIYPEGHVVTREMERDAADWFDAHLQ